MTLVDAAVIGAGPAGCSTAIYLAKRGLSVALIDKARFPRPKACGEGIMPSGLSVLDELGVLPEVEKTGRHYTGIQFTSFNGKKAIGHFGVGRYGIALRRETLDSILIEKAKATQGIRVLESTKITAPIFKNGTLCGWNVNGETAGVRTAHTFIADGAHSAAARMLNIERIYPSRRRFGMRTHFERLQGLGNLVEVYFLREGEIYVAPQGNDTALISVLVEEAAMSINTENGKQMLMSMVRSCPQLKTRMAGAKAVSEIIGTGPLGGRSARWHGPGWTLVGDCAGSVDPITGEGISLALLNGKMAAEHFISGARAAAYDRNRIRLMRKKNNLARVLLNASDKPWLCNFLIAWLALRPSDFDYFLSGC